MSRDIRCALNHPDDLFRRVRDKHGELRLSKAAAAYHPGRGVYRSSYKNALRLTATENNMAYRESDHLRWQQNPFVIGVRIQVSKTNHPVTDICDELAGDYPKDFKWTGWHPFCRCFATAITASEKERDKYWDAMADGEDVRDWHFAGEVKEMPKNFTGWVDANIERAKGWKSLPYFIRDNMEHSGGMKANVYTDDEKLVMRKHKHRDTMERILGLKLHDDYPNIENTEIAAIYHYTRGDIRGFRQFNKHLREGTTNEYEEAYAGLITKGLEKLPPHEGVVYRSMRLNKKGFAAFIQEHQVGSEVVYKGFTSTSESEDVAKSFNKFREKKNNEQDVLISIKSKKGRKLGSLSQYSGNEDGLANQEEVLFKRNSRFRVISVSKDFSRVEIEEL